MTKEEKQFNQWFDWYADGVKVFEEADMKQAYLQGRAELEKENAELQNKVDTLQGFLDRDVEFDNLQKENAELKKLKRECETSLCRAEYQYNYEQLTKAKEHIRTLISCLIDWVQEGDKDYCHIADAEQFLKSEVEK